MKKKNKILALLLTLIMCVSFSATAFAAEPASPDISDSMAEAERHTITIEVAPGEEIGVEDGIMPLMWDESHVSLMNGSSADTVGIYLEDRYIAYEASETGPHGETITSGTFGVALMRNGATKASVTGDADGSIYKKDWITMTSGTYYFHAVNNTPAILNFHIKYYSWK